MNIGYDIESIQKLNTFFSLSELKQIYSHLRTLIKGLRTRKTISNSILKISEKLKILHEMGQEIQAKEMTSPYVILPSDLEDLEDLGEFKTTIKNILKPSRTKSEMFERLMELVRLFHSVNFNLTNNVSENSDFVREEELETENSDFEVLEDVEETQSIYDTENETEIEENDEEFIEFEENEKTDENELHSSDELSQKDDILSENDIEEGSEVIFDDEEEKMSEIEF